MTFKFKFKPIMDTWYFSYFSTAVPRQLIKEIGGSQCQQVVESMTIMAGSKAAGGNGAGAVPGVYTLRQPGGGSGSTGVSTHWE